MPVIGTVVAPNGKQPRVHAVILQGTLAEPTYIGKFELRTSSTEPSEQAVDLARALSSKINQYQLEGAGIRIAGTTPVARRSKASFVRAHCEGALLFVLREALSVPVVTMDPVSAPKAFGMKKAEFEELRDSVASMGGNAEAVVGALAALAAR